MVVMVKWNLWHICPTFSFVSYRSPFVWLSLLVLCGSWAKWIEEWHTFKKDNPDYPLFEMSYEDMKKVTGMLNITQTHCLSDIVVLSLHWFLFYHKNQISVVTIKKRQFHLVSLQNDRLYTLNNKLKILVKKEVVDKAWGYKILVQIISNHKLSIWWMDG
jgi:hypothetical protein